MATKSDWQFVYSEGHSLLMCQAWVKAFSANPKVPGQFETAVFDIRNGMMTCHTTGRILERIRREGKAFFDKAYRLDFISSQRSSVKPLENLYAEFDSAVVGSLGNDALWRMTKRFFEGLSEANAYFQVSGGRCFPLLEESVKAGLSAVFANRDLERSYTTLLTATELDILQREELDLIRLSQAKATTNALLEHSEKYALLYFNTYDRKTVLNFLEKRANDYRKNNVKAEEVAERIQQEKKDLKEKQRQLAKRIGDPATLERLSFLRNQGWLRFELKDVWAGAEYRFLPLFEHLAEKAGLPVADFMAAYGLEDIQTLLQNGQRVDPTEVQNRKKHCLFYLHNGVGEFHSGRQADVKADALFGTAKKKWRQVHGVAANPGVARGRVRVVKAFNLETLQKDLDAFAPGEILVTTMTQPNMIFLMKKAAAIVTSQGGITSHAAVMSRELGIPCVVGTKIATLAFKTGDLVEVDAGQGIVKKIKPPKHV